MFDAAFLQCSCSETVNVIAVQSRLEFPGTVGTFVLLCYGDNVDAHTHTPDSLQRLCNSERFCR